MHMNENNAAGTADSEQGWDSIDLSDLSPEGGETGPVETDTGTGTGETAEPTVEPKPEGTDAASEQPGESGNAGQSFTLSYMGEEKSFSREDTIALAQKGMDYDRLMSSLNEQTRLAGERAEADEFVQALSKEQGVTPQEWMDNLRAGMLAKQEGISNEEALSRVKLERREKAVAAREKAAEDKAKAGKEEEDEKQRVRNDFLAFMRARPEVKAEDIPKEVYLRMREGVSLLQAYTEHENAQLRAQLEAARQNQKNKERSVGSSSTSGKAAPKDEFDSIWYDGT